MQKFEINTGNTRGITRKVDFQGRTIIPSEFRKELGIKENDEIEIFLLNEGIYIKKKI